MKAGWGLVVAGMLWGMASPAIAYDVHAGPIWNTDDARQKCPAVCAGAQWNGRWSSDQDDVAVCGTTTGEPARVGVISSDAEAARVCPQALAAATWQGAWATVSPGDSICGCVPPPLYAGNEQPSRAARMIHLHYEAPEAELFYNEVRIEASYPGSYFAVCGFRHGYFGLQELFDRRKVAIFSVWEPDHGQDPTQVPLAVRTEPVAPGAGVDVRRFGNEGTGGQSFLNFDWQPGQTYRFLVEARHDGDRTAYTGFVYLPTEQRWQKMVTFRALADNDLLRDPYSFVEDFRADGISAQQIHRARYGNGWMRDTAGRWHPLTRATFTAMAPNGNLRSAIDAGQQGGDFYLQTGAGTVKSRGLGQIITLDAVPGLLPEDVRSWRVGEIGR